MYGYEWTKKHGIYRLVPNAKVIKEIRPVFKKELDYFGMNAHWKYPDTDAPLLWAEGIRRYNLNGECIAEGVGGGFYTKPIIRIKEGYEKLKLKAVDINALWKENERLMLGLEKTAIDFIRKVHDDYKKRGMKFVVAFSGGKDSLVLLDLVAKALRPDEFVVIFSNTGMELSITLEAVERAKQHWNKLRFEEAASHMTPDETWEAFGTPGRRLRWCCSVHKSVPTILKLREITGDYNARAVVFEGVRKEESATRQGYDYVRDSVKNINQINVSPILDWGTAEVYLYLLKNNIFFNDAYRFGVFRCGCMVCPQSSNWWDGITNDLYKDELQPLFSKVEKYSEFVSTKKSRKKFIEDGSWKGRIGGFNIEGGGNRVDEVVCDNKIVYRFERTLQSWNETSKILGEIVEKNDDVYTQIIEHQSYDFKFSESDNEVTYSPYSNMDRYDISHLRAIANKVAYCVGCKACAVQCPTGAFEIDSSGKIKINEVFCTHCYNCIKFTDKGCLVALTMHSTIGGTGMKLKGSDSKYRHFGFRRPWLEHFLEYGIKCFDMRQLGSVQYYALKFWLIDAGLLTAANRGEKYGVPTPLCERLRPLGAGNPLTWAILWTNLAYTSVITKWYMLAAQAGEIYDKPGLVFMLGEEYSPSTRDNAVTALLETLRLSPVGAVLKQGIPIPDGNSYKYLKQGWDSPEAVAILYALYKYAEETGIYTTTLAKLTEARGNAEIKGVDPVSIFGLDPSKFKEILQDVALAYGNDYLRVVFQQDLDNIVLNPKKKAIDILDLVSI
jgi:phosphoadenosine phosphosulfate reductase